MIWPFKTTPPCVKLPKMNIAGKKMMNKKKKTEAPKLILRQLLWTFFINNQLLRKYVE